jgi:hypothetical protein
MEDNNKNLLACQVISDNHVVLLQVAPVCTTGCACTFHNFLLNSIELGQNVCHKLSLRLIWQKLDDLGYN